MTILREAHVYHDGTFAGILQESDEGYLFVYDSAYLAAVDAKPVSLPLPKQTAPHVNSTMFPFFDGLIPEGWLLEVACETWKVDRRDRMGLLMVACEDCIGAVTVRGVFPVEVVGRDA